jgi:hypothetical protein
MKVDTSLIASSTSGLASTSRNNTSSSFQSSLEKALADLTSNADTQTTGTTKVLSHADKVKAAQAADEAAIAEFHAYMSKTPEQRMREAILKEMGLTEEDLKAMPPEKRKAVEAAITEKIRDRMEAQLKEKADAIAAKRAASGQIRPLSIL